MAGTPGTYVNAPELLESVLASSFSNSSEDPLFST
jgi:hypothetical protein